MPIDPALTALLQETSGANALEGVTGSAGTPEWPKPGYHAAYFKGITVAPGVFKAKDTQGANADFKAISVQFHYGNLTADPTSQNTDPLEWSGSFFNLPVNEAGVPGNADKSKGVGFRIDNDKQRFMGLAKCVLGADVAMAHKSYTTLIPALVARIEDTKTKAAAATINVMSRTDNKVNPPKTYLSEWGVNALSS